MNVYFSHLFVLFLHLIIPIIIKVLPYWLYTHQSLHFYQFPLHHSSNPGTQSYLPAQTLGHIVHFLVDILVHYCCQWLYLFHSLLSVAFHSSALRVHVQVVLYLDQVLIHRYFICPFHQSGSNRKIQSSQHCWGRRNLIKEISYAADGRADNSKYKNSQQEGMGGRDQWWTHVLSHWGGRSQPAW